MVTYKEAQKPKKIGQSTQGQTSLAQTLRRPTLDTTPATAA